MPRWQTFSGFLADALNAPSADRAALVDVLLAERRFPWIEGEQATFTYRGSASTVALNLDVIPGDPPFDPMQRLPDTDLWYVTRAFQRDDLLDYLLAIDDPMTPLAAERHLLKRVADHWRPDPLNPLRMEMAGQSVSVLRMDAARPLPDWSRFSRIERGSVREHVIASNELDMRGRKLWLYLPPGYADSEHVYPLLVLHDGQWMHGPLQVPLIADALIQHGRMQPAVIAMIQSATGAERDREYIANDAHYAFLVHELLPDLHTRYYIDATRVVLGGVDVGAAAALYAALKNPVAFSRVIAVSPPLGKGAHAEKLRPIANQLADAGATLPRRIFLSVGRYEGRARFVRPVQVAADALTARADVRVSFVETGSGHGLVGFKSVLPEALAWALPGVATG